MALINWDDSLKFGIKSIDEQHEQLVNIINDLHAAMLEGKSREIMEDILERLVGYVDKHFKFEEEIMKEHGASFYQSHIGQHKQYTEKFNDIQKKFKEGKIVLSIDIMNYLKDWWRNHILVIDKNYVPLFNEKGID